MSSPLYPARAFEPPRANWINRILGALMVVGAGVLLGSQYMEPDKRVLAVLAALVVFGVAWRLDTVSGIGILCLAMPFPRGTVFGSSNLALILLLLVIWLLRVSTRQALPLRRTPIDFAVGGFFLSYIISFYNVPGLHELYLSLENFQLFTGTLLLFYLVTTNLRTEQDLRRVQNFQVIAVLLICLVAMYELKNPGGALVRGWIDFTNTHGTEFNTHNIRVGSVFFDYELLSEFCALNLLFLIFLFIRAKQMLNRLYLGGVIACDVFVWFATCTRGSFMSMGIGILYLLWLTRRHVRIVPFVIMVALAVGSFFAISWYMLHFTATGDLLSRFSETTFSNGLPDARKDIWQEAWLRMLEHPIIGHGPFYTQEAGVIKPLFWPHNVYLYVGNLVGFFGLSFFVMMLLRLLYITRPQVDDLSHPDFLKSYLLLAHVQLVVFMVDQAKIEYLRNFIYPFQVWLWFSMIVAAAQISRANSAGGAAATDATPAR